MRHARLSLPFVAALALLALVRPSAQTPDVVAHIERYARGEHDAVVRQLESLKSYDDLLDQLRLSAPAWIDAAPETGRFRRRLAAATFALEAARAAGHVDWKWVRRMTRENDEPQDADHIFWKAPPLLIEWGCALLRADSPARPSERTWHLAAIAVAQRAGDFEFLVGSPVDARMNPEDEINHVDHALGRFKEPRFLLATAIALDSTTWSRQRDFARPRQAQMALRTFEGLIRDDAVGAEALMRMGALHARLNRRKDALEAFAKAELATRDRYVVYLSRYFKGQVLTRSGDRDDAERAYRAALAVIPQAQSATLALASLLATQGRRVEAGALIEAQLSTSPQPPDPWKAYGAADDRFWPELIAVLRLDIRP